MDVLTRPELLLDTGSHGMRDAATILVVDDAEINRIVLADLLEPHYRVRLAGSGPTALRAARQSPAPALILLDVVMPGMDGLAVLRALKADAATADIPVIFISALDDASDETRGIELGAIDYIAKPLDPALTLARVRGHLERSRSHDALRRENESLGREVSRRLAQLRIFRDVSVRTMANLAEVRDHETGDHLVRTQAYVRTLAEALAAHPDYAGRLRPEFIEMVSEAAPLHDIGKIGIPDQVLLKPGPLTDEEWRVMQTHAALGAEALRRSLRADAGGAAIEFLQVAADIAQSHHERWDGRGYPEGLAGRSIPLAARLMAVADVFDALITPRPYKQAMPVEQAIEVIREGAGTHFDPDVTAAFEARLPAIRAIASRHAGAAGD